MTHFHKNYSSRRTFPCSFINEIIYQPRFKEAHTYINITKSDLVAVLVAGSATSVARGWGQLVYLPAELNSFDPDEPDTQERSC